MAAPNVPFGGVFYIDFIAAICKLRAAQTYLEIGVQNGVCLSQIEVGHAIGVDPDFRLSADPTQGKRSLELHRLPSDQFFAHAAPKRVDLAFLDGMHLFEFLLRDFYNTEANSHKNGLVLMHDCLPFSEAMVARKDTNGPWTGDVWKLVQILEKYRKDLKVVLIDCAPTGLVAVSNLDPTSTVLQDKYLEIVDEFRRHPNDLAALDAFYEGREIVSASAILNDMAHTLFFRF